MRKMILGGAAFAALMASSLIAGPAMAADLPVEAPIYVERPAAVGLLNWTGFYVGANIGYARGRGSDDIFDFIAGAPLLSLSQSMSGVIGGGQIGGNWQTGNAVFGLEADIQGSGQSVSTTAPGFMSVTNPDGSITVVGVTASNTDKVTSFGTLRGRVGIAAGRWLYYVTAGMAYGTWRSNLTVTGVGTASFSSGWNGGVVGGGVEAAIADNWTVRAEYLYLESRMISNNPFPAAPNLAVNTRVQDSIFRVGLNYMFFTGSVGCRPHVC
jgi:outer membrane immunogenic protein